MRLSIYLLNRSTSKINNVSRFVEPGTLRKSLKGKSIQNYRKGMLFYSVYKPSVTWLESVNSLLQKPLSDPQKESIRSVLILQVNKRYFALSFNNGISLVKSEFIDYNFGFKIAKKLLDTKQISSYYSTDFTEQIINTKNHSRASIPTYIINNPKRLRTVSSLSGKDSTNKKSISGRYNLVIDFNGNLKTELIPYLEGLSNLYFDKSKEGIDLSNGLIEVNNEEDIKKLNEKFFMNIKEWCIETEKRKSLSASQLKNVDFNIQDDLSAENLLGYRITGIHSALGHKGFVFSDLNKYSYFEKFCNQIKEKELTQTYIISKLKRDSIFSVREEEDVKIGNVYNSLIITYPIDKTERKAILIAGNWYYLSANYFLELEKKIKVYLNRYKDIVLDGFSKKDTVLKKGKPELSEGAYNKRVASMHDLYVLDQQFYKYPEDIKRFNFNLRSKIEPCDLLKYDQGKLTLWHVKRGSGAQGLSHLATQAEIGARLLSDPEQKKDFISFINSKLGDIKIPASIKKEDITIILAITKKNPEKEVRNNFTLLELKALEKVLTDISSLGFNVSLNLIKDNTL